MTSELQEQAHAKITGLAFQAAKDSASSAIAKAIKNGKATLNITIKLATMGGDMSAKTKWKCKAGEEDGDELPEETISEQPELGIK